MPVMLIYQGFCCVVSDQEPLYLSLISYGRRCNTSKLIRVTLSSIGGSQFVSRMLTVVTSLKAQQRNVLDFLGQACGAARLTQPTPSLLPQSQPQKHDSPSPQHKPLFLA